MGLSFSSWRCTTPVKVLPGRSKTKRLSLEALSQIPPCLYGFFVIGNGWFLTPAHAKVLNNASKWLFMLTFAGVGLSTEFKQMKSGFKPFLVGFGVEAIVRCHLSSRLLSNLRAWSIIAPFESGRKRLDFLARIFKKKNRFFGFNVELTN